MRKKKMRMKIKKTVSVSIVSINIIYIFIVLTSSVAGTVNHANVTGIVDISCIHCHSRELAEFQNSIHYGNISCDDCHGGNIVINGTVTIGAMVNFTDIKVNITDICSNCHSDVVKLYKQSVHANAYRQKGIASCIDCHNAHDILSYKDPRSRTYFENVPILCAQCHENKTKMSAWYYGISTDRFDTYKNSFHYRAILLSNAKERFSGGKGYATCPDCHENHNTRNESDTNSAIYPSNLVKTCQKRGCHSGEQKVLIYGGKVHEGKSVYLLYTNIDLKAIVTYFYIVMIIFELLFTFGLIFLGIYSGIEIKKNNK